MSTNVGISVTTKLGINMNTSVGINITPNVANFQLTRVRFFIHVCFF